MNSSVYFADLLDHSTALLPQDIIGVRALKTTRDHENSTTEVIWEVTGRVVLTHNMTLAEAKKASKKIIYLRMLLVQYLTAQSRVATKSKPSNNVQSHRRSIMLSDHLTDL